MANLHYFFGPIGCGKAVKLIQDRYNFIQKGVKVLVIKPQGNNNEPKIKSRIGLECPAEICNTIDWTDFIRRKNGIVPEVIMIYDVHLFTPRDIDNLVKLADNYGKLIFCYGLLIDTDEKMYPASKHLLEVGAKFQEIKLSCETPGCKNLADHNVCYDEYNKIIKNSKLIPQDKNHVFKSLCRVCFDRETQKYR